MIKACMPLQSSRCRSLALSIIHWAIPGTSQILGQTQPANLPLGIHREAPLPGWIPGQWSWPALSPHPILRWTSTIAGRYHPNITALSELSWSVGYRADQDWLTFGITQYGGNLFRRHRLCLGFSKSLAHNRVGVTLQWNRLAQQTIPWQRLSAGLGTEQEIGPLWRIGFGIEHPMILPRLSGIEPALDPSKDAVHGLHLGIYGRMRREPWLIQIATHYNYMEGWRQEMGCIYIRESGLGFVLSADPGNAIFNFGICYRKGKQSFWASSLQSTLPGLSYQAAWEGGLP